MKVSIVVNGRFHAFDLAAQLERRGHLLRLITSYPASKAREWGVPASKVSALVPTEVFNRAIQNLPERVGWTMGLWQRRWFGRWAAGCIPADTDLAVVWSGSSRDALQRARALGTNAVVVRSSSHINYQSRILAQEYQMHGMQWVPTHPQTIQTELWEYANCNAIEVPSHFARQSFVDEGVDASRLLHNAFGVATDKFSPAPKEDDYFRVIYVGALTLRKGVQYLLQAWHELALPRAELWIIGNPTREASPFLTKYRDSFKHFAAVPLAALRWYYSQGSVFAMCSVEEGLAMVQVQAMACGLPLIATTNTGIADLVSDGEQGFIIPIRNINVLKEKILYMYQHEAERQRMATAALAQAQRFTWDAYGERAVAAYARVLDVK
jgi:glycosyltransferase involved in cell wall biosynthesis